MKDLSDCQILTCCTFLLNLFLLSGNGIATEEEVTLGTVEVSFLFIREDGELPPLDDTTAHRKQFCIPLIGQGTLQEKKIGSKNGQKIVVYKTRTTYSYVFLVCVCVCSIWE